MADAYVDFVSGSDANDGLSWANAELTLQAGITTAGSGGRCFVQTNAAATTKDTAASTRTLTFPGTDQVPFGLYGVKNGTTAEPPTDSDLAVRGTDNLPVFAATGSANDIILEEATGGSAVYIVVQGIRFESADQIRPGSSLTVEYYDCEFDCDNFQGGSQSYVKATNCEFEFNAAGGDIAGNEFALDIIGGLFSGVAVTPVFDQLQSVEINCYGVNASLITGTLMDLNASSNSVVRLINCKLAAGVTRVTGTSRVNSFIELIGSSSETGLGSGESVRDYAKEYFRGTVLSEATIIRTGGANDGVAGFSLVIQPKAASTKESLLGIPTPWFGGIVKGDATTSKDFTVYIANDSAADLTDADVWVELLFPSEAGTTDHGLDISSRRAIDATPSNVADDTVSDWSTGAGGKNAQKIIITKTPDFQGPVYARVHFAQVGTTKCYVDPKVYVTDT